MNLSTNSSPQFSSKDYTILIVDDKPENLGMLSNFLEVYGFNIAVAQSSKIGVNRASLLNPDIILLDVMMPELDGFEVCRRLKQNANTQDIPIIFMTALTDLEHKVQGFEVGAVDYITKPIQHQEVLARITTHLTISTLRKTLEEKIEDLQAFAHTVAHDLKSPLTQLLLVSELLSEDDQLPVKFQDDASLMHRSAHRISSTVDGLLLLSTIGNVNVALRSLNMAKIVAESLAHLELMIKKFKPEITMPDRWPISMGHSPWIVQVWVNYLSNAIKYGGNPARITLGATPTSDGQIRYWVKDNGIGLAPHEQENLFSEFSRVNEGVAKGHGLGLSIVKRIISKLGGQVGVESQKGEGCTFYFTLKEYVDASIANYSSFNIAISEDKLKNNSDEAYDTQPYLRVLSDPK